MTVNERYALMHLVAGVFVGVLGTILCYALVMLL